MAAKANRGHALDLRAGNEKGPREPSPLPNDPDTEEELPPAAKRMKFSVCSKLTNTGNWNVDLLNMYLEEDMYDCSFKVCFNNREHKIFKCHRLILAKCSDVFRAMLYGEFAEAKKGPDNEIIIDGFPPGTFDTAMRFVYGQWKDFRDVNHALDVLQFADKFGLEKLVEASITACWQFDSEPIFYVKMHSVFDKLHFHSDANEALKLISANCGEIILSHTWGKVAEASVKLILEQDSLNITSEMDLYYALINWGKTNLEPGPHEDHKKMLRERLGSLLPLLRFQTLTAADLATIGQSNEVLTEAEHKKMLTGKILNNYAELPVGFSNSDTPRMFHSDADAAMHFLSFNVLKIEAYDAPPLRFQVTRDTYLLALKIFSVTHFNKDKFIELSIRVWQEDVECGHGFFEGRGSTEGDEVYLEWPVLLQTDLEYIIEVEHSNPYQECAKIFPVVGGLGQFDTSIVTILDGPRGFGEIVGFLFAPPCHRS